MSGGYDLTYISFGAGTQSTAMAICSALGLHGVPRADYAIFADTKDELAETYRHVNRMTEWLASHKIPVHVSSQGNLMAELRGAQAKGRAGYIVSIPAFTESRDGRAGTLRRQCTKEYKLEPIQRHVRKLLGFGKGERIAGKKRARALIGISLDELIRAKPSRVPWITNSHPLIDARLRVDDCARICLEHLGHVPSKSACKACPYHDDRYWAWLKKGSPKEFEEACRTDDAIRNLARAGVKRPCYLHRSLKPLREVDFEREKGQLRLDGFGDECEGMCGV